MTVVQIAQSEAFHNYIAPNLWIAYAAFAIGIAGLCCTAVIAFYEGLKKEV